MSVVCPQKLTIGIRKIKSARTAGTVYQGRDVKSAADSEQITTKM